MDSKMLPGTILAGVAAAAAVMPSAAPLFDRCDTDSVVACSQPPDPKHVEQDKTHELPQPPVADALILGNTGYAAIVEGADHAIGFGQSAPELQHIEESHDSSRVPDQVVAQVHPGSISAFGSSTTAAFVQPSPRYSRAAESFEQGTPLVMRT